MGKIYFSSDWHFGHNKDFLYEPRGFENIDNHDDIVIYNHNSIVELDDDVYILGDLMLNDNEKGLEKIAAMHGKLHIILGNHDTDTRIELYKNLPNVVEITYATMLKYKKAHFYLSHYPTLTANYDDDKPWHKNLINLHGHTHFKDKFYDNNPYMYNVGLDAHNNCPVEIEQIMEDIRQKKTELNNGD